MKDLHEQKAVIRREMLGRRSALTPEAAEAMGEVIAGHLMGTDVYRRARCISCYVSVKKEADTHRLIRAALADGKRVGVPVTRAGGRLIHVEIPSLSALEPASFGLLEPPASAGAEIPPADFDLVIVPGVAFDRLGNRIGQAGGYYDRFLPLTSAPKVALAYDFQIAEDLPVDAHDVPVDILVTESGVHSCGNGVR